MTALHSIRAVALISPPRGWRHIVGLAVCVHRRVAPPVERPTRLALPPVWPLWTAFSERVCVAVAAHSVPKPQATIEVAVGCATGHVSLVVNQLSGQKASSADIELHAGGAVAASGWPTVAVAAAAVEGSFAAVVLAGRPNPHTISAPVLRYLCAGSVMPFLQRCWRSGLNKYSSYCTRIHNISTYNWLHYRNKLQTQVI